MSDVALAKWFAKEEIDRRAGELRARFITDVPGQQAVYMMKLAEARAYLVDQNAAAPHIAAEAQALGQTAAQVAAAVVATADTWNTVLSPAIEAARLGGKAAVDVAVDQAGVSEALSAAVATLAGIG